MRHFEEMVTNGDWDEVEKYLSGFTKVDDNRYSMKIFFEIRKQKYLEALDRFVLLDVLSTNPSIPYYSALIICLQMKVHYHIHEILFWLQEGPC